MTTATAPARTFGRARAVPTEAPAPRNVRGWGGVQKMAASIGSGDMFFKVEEQKKLIAFADEFPFDWNASHWLDFIREGSKSVICWDSLLDDDDNPTMPEPCHLCRAGDKPKKLSVFFNVISLENPTDPSLKVLEAGKMLVDLIQDCSEDQRTSPLNKGGLYFEISKSGDSKKPTPKLTPIKARDLLEDYGITPLPDEAIAELVKNRKTTPIKDPLSAAEMAELAAMLP